jgi:hypothetical protein
MTTLSIKDVPEQWAEALRQRAARNHRSLQGELALQRSVVAEPSSQNAAPGTPRRPAGFVRPGSKTIEQIYAEHLERFPTPFTEGPMSVDIIRQDRDSR